MTIEDFDDEPTERDELLSLTSYIVAAYVGNNAVATADLPALIVSVHSELAGLGKLATEPEAELVPAVAIKKSVAPEALTCLECGRKMKMLKRHISTDHGLTPDEYRTKWGLKFDYPMVALAYRQVRQELALKIGLGRKAAPKSKRSKKG